MIEARKKFGTALLCLLLLLFVFTVCAAALPDSVLFQFLQPFSVFLTFLQLWFGFAGWIILLLAVLPPIGWLLLNKEKAVGRYLILIPQWLTLASACVLTPLHVLNEFAFINATGGRSGNDLGMTLLTALPAIVYPIAVLILTSKWKPNIK